MHDRLAARSALLFSDVHLSADAPLLSRALARWLTVNVIDADAPPQLLIILGDLFDAWVGDDCLQAMEVDSVQRDVIDALVKIHGCGIEIALMHGNRDFLLGESFARQCGARLLQDPSLLAIDGGMRIALTHGDQLCTQDTDYQLFRQQVRANAWQAEFLAQPLPQRFAAAKNLRAKSEIEKGTKSMAIMDVTSIDAELLADRLEADLLLHGHTHRPGCSVMPHGKLRWVLPDWEVDARGEVIRGGGLWVDAHGVRPVK